MDSSIVGFTAILGALFAIANPFSGLPFFLGYSAPLTSWREKFTAAIITSATIWVGATVVLLAGHAVLSFFGISIAGLRVGGGLVILISGLSMMNTKVDDTKKSGRSLARVVHDLVRRGHTPHGAASAVHASSPEAAASLREHAATSGDDAVSAAISHAAKGEPSPNAAAPDADAERKNKKAAYLSLMFPFAIPMVLGPGFMSTILIAQHSNGAMPVLGAYSIIIGISFIAFLLAAPIRAALGTFGMNVLLRLVGLIVIVLAVEIMAAGLVKLLPGMAG
ncbi:MarC family protein [uncultured Microbacterium sp.]|uniref:MarC family protein n=1 Tax=uncultured Microbacterium sp. TaxID=191216 RepID=UPI00261CF27E|nr:MarC family protein [uncultured Microbacterium sp.]